MITFLEGNSVSKPMHGGYSTEKGGSNVVNQQGTVGGFELVCPPFSLQFFFNPLICPLRKVLYSSIHVL